ncbi:MAG: hypothetical protein LBC07_01140, partial [Elusimicrobiota bacterium]|nr:hypothetical protein [Elusimicrobiota bacterium]
ERISPKPLSIAIGARTKYVDDAYEYEKIAGIVDRVIIMAYDEHWSTSSPGPIASFAWCAQVAQYALAHIPVQKIVMGMPFYGRAWANINPSRAYKHEGIANLIASKKIANVNVKDDIPYFTYQQTVNVTVYYENSLTIMKRSKIYYDLKIKNIAFWRLGQEEVSVWDGLAKSLFTDEVFLNQAIAKPAPAPKPKTQTAQTKKSQSPPKKTTAAKK